MEQTNGQRIVRMNFNPSDETYVYKLKEKSAELIDLITEMGNDMVDSQTITEKDLPEFIELLNIAKRKYEESCMWAVKAATLHL